MKRCLLILLFCLVGNVVSAYSAGDTCLAKVNIDLTDDTSSVIDFGYVYVGDTLNSGVVIVRTGPNAVQLPSAAPPYFVKSTTPNSSSANDFEEFDVSINTFPFRLSNIESFKNFPIQFIARDSSIYKSGKKEAKLNFSVRGDPDASCVAVNRGITVRATKSFMPLWTDDSYLSFDSVYVNPVSQIVDTIRIHNVYKIDTIKADTTSFNYTKRAQSVFTFAPNQKLSFAPKPGFENPFVTRYFPTQRGVDSVLYKFIHKNPYYSKATPQIDTMYVTAFGVGVEQKLSIAEVQPANAKIINDTINVGAIHAEQPDTIRIVLRNDGNIAFHHEGISLTNQETFQLERAINVNGVFLPPDATDTLSIIIKPKNEGLFESVCTIKSDISTRVRGVPVSVKEITFVITGQSIRPRIEPLSNVVRFDSVIVFDECLWDTTKTLTLRNVSNYASEITSVVVIPSNAPFFVTKQPFTLQPGNSEKVDIVFSPRTVGSFSAVLQITTKENNLPIVVNLVGKGIESKPISCKVPLLQTIKPGNK
ncbi:MAG: choice-of-anchor D domain-containing protein, partial [Candidatus Kapabacteria bacterium]|nr:choice-of-anchor D domain-containing protein [Candidatus Kapabacteria bacterium]